MNRIILSGFLMSVAALPVLAQEQPPVFDGGFGIKNIGLNLNYESFLGFEQSPDGGFYLSGSSTLSKLGNDGSGLWSILYGWVASSV